jgi:hypothetical protein
MMERISGGKTPTQGMQLVARLDDTKPSRMTTLDGVT